MPAAGSGATPGRFSAFWVPASPDLSPLAGSTAIRCSHLHSVALPSPISSTCSWLRSQPFSTAHLLRRGTHCHVKRSQPCAAPGCTPGWGALLWAAHRGWEPGGGSWQERSSCRRTKACHRRPMIYTLNYAYCTRSPNVWKCHTALTIVPNFCPPINVQFPSKDKAVHYFWLTNSAQCTLIFPHALGGQMLHRDCLRAMTEQAHF